MTAGTRSVRGRLATGVAWLTSARVIANILQAISTLVLARLLVPSEIGVVVVALTMLAIIGSVTELSLSSALIQHRDPGREHFTTVWTLTVARGLALAVIFAGTAIPASIIYADARLANVMFALSLGLLITGFRNPSTVALNKELIFWQDSLLQVVGKFVTIAVSLTIAVLYRSYWALVLGGLAGQLVTVLLSYLIVPFRPSFSLRHARELFAFSAWLTLGQLVATLNANFDNLLVGAVLGSATIGLYAVGHAFAGIPTREALSPLMSVFFPAFATFRDEPERMAEAYCKAQSLVFAVGLPVGIGLAIVADPLIRLALGDSWLGSIPVVQTLAPIYAVQTVAAMAAPVAMASGHTRLLFIRDLQAFAIRVPLMAIGMAVYALPGLLVAHVIAGLVMIPLTLGVARRAANVKASRHLASNLRSLLAALIMAGIVLTLDRLVLDRLWNFGAGAADLIARLTILVPVGVAAYSTTHWLVWQLLGRPRGPEHEVWRFCDDLIRRRLRSKPRVP